MDREIVIIADRDLIGVSDMNVLEKILEEIGVAEGIRFSRYTELLIAVKDVENIIRSHMGDGKDTNVPSNGGWVPVEERLPGNSANSIYDMQLVTLKDGEVCLGVYRNKDGEWWTRKQEGETHYTNKHEVIAWQPLPEPYKED